MKRAILCTSAFILAAASIAFGPMLFAQATAAPAAPSFDVGTIKPHPSDGDSSWIGIRITPDGFEGASATIPILIQRAYGLRSIDQVSGCPEWAKNERLDIRAKMSDEDIADMQRLSPAEAKARRELMMQALLAKRFKGEDTLGD
jgi:uncharacterized protein (TIGR03435 family)